MTNHRKNKSTLNPNEGSLFDLFIFCIIIGAFTLAIYKGFIQQDVKRDCREAWDNGEPCHIER